MSDIEVQFYHPVVVPTHLTINTKPDQIVWNYGLNVQKFPTYGGEVVQILSVFFDDMTIAGTVATYAQMEEIYAWFIQYMQVATQGNTSTKHYNQQPVTFRYPERDWTFQIWPKSLPGFRYGRDVVAPTWSLVAAVKEPDAVLAHQITAYSAKAAATQADFQLFGKATVDFGTTADLLHNPWASPDADPTINGKTTMASFLSQQTKSLADTFSHWVSDYSNGSLPPALTQNVSKAPGYVADGGTAPAPTQKKGTVKKR